MWCNWRCFRKHVSITGECLVYPDTKLFWKTIVPEKHIICERLILSSPTDDKTKYKIWYEGEMSELTYEESLNIFNSKPKRPWIWIGDTKHNMLQTLDEYLVIGNKITLELLQIINPEIKEWKYICSQTLDMLNFPSDGIIIYDSIITKNKKEE